MGTIGDLKKRFQTLDIDKVSTDSMEETTPLIADRQRDQMLSGKNAKGQVIRRYKSNAYAIKKHAMNAIPGFGNWDAYLTGAFQREIFSEVRGEKMVISSTNEKTAFLEDLAGEELFGLDRPTKKEFIQKDLRPVFMKQIRRATGL